MSRRNSNDHNQYATPPSGSNPAAAVSSSMMMAMMRSANSAGAINNNAANSNKPNGNLLNHNDQSEARMGQILDDADHRRCSEGNQRALLAEKLENLRRLTKEIEKDDWMYEPAPKSNGMTLSTIRPKPTVMNANDMKLRLPPF